MRITKMFTLILAVAFSASAFAVDGAATFKSRCVICHGPDAMGKTGPALKGTTLTGDEIAALLSKRRQRSQASPQQAAGVPLRRRSPRRSQLREDAEIGLGSQISGLGSQPEVRVYICHSEPPRSGGEEPAVFWGAKT